ncbi:MAG TPA: carboxymuconolactone decarboxylase family protein [Gammaproteobacteria bacterium]|nr:carboxymuconolactone decarboxylase family protein [Gammaproteobacteria bacterium]
MRRLLIITVILTLTCGACTSSREPAEPVVMPEPDNLDLVGNRFPPLTWDEMTDAQKAMVSHVLDGPRNSLGGPFNVMLRSPEMGDAAQQLGTFSRFNTMPGKLRELAIIMTARFWTSHFEWYAHKDAALREGLDPAVVDAIANGESPTGMDADETAVYKLVSELLYDRRVSDATFETAVATLGERGVVDVVGIVGYYGMVSLFLNIDEYPLPDGVEIELQPLP